MVDNIYCINLERSSQRRESALQEFEREGLDVEFFRATDGKVEAPSGIYISKPEWGCADSHIRVWRDIVANGYETALVFEDDISLVPDFNYKLEQIISELPPNWDYVNLGASDAWRIDVKKVSKTVYTGQALLAHGYLIRLDCAKKWSTFDSTHLKTAIDILMTYFPTHNLQITDPIVIQKGSTLSTISNNFNGRSIDYTLLIKQWGRFIVFLLTLTVLLYIFRKQILG